MQSFTKYILTGWLKSNQGKIVNRNHYVCFEDKKVTWETMERYILTKQIYERYYYSVREIVDLLNDCAGEDCYNGDWHYEIDEEGQIYCDVYRGVLVVGWR